MAPDPGTRSGRRLSKRGEEPDGFQQMGLEVRLKDPDQGTWIFDRGEVTARRTTPLRSPHLVETCGKCHVRRAQLTDDFTFGQPLLNSHLISLLDEPLYFSDGQIRDEVYVYASFRQTKMYLAGVTCVDCHDPHSARVRSEDNTLCYRCHLYEKYGVKEHHFHKPDSTGARCVECHMPERTYMVVDPRRDHSIRSPRPDLARKWDLPDACSRCHADKSLQWNIDAFLKWYGGPEPFDRHYGEMLSAADRGDPRVVPELLAYIQNTQNPEIVRASAILRLADATNPAVLATLTKAAEDPAPLVRMATARSAIGIPQDRQVPIIRRLLDDPVRAVRLETTNLVAEMPAQALPPDLLPMVKQALAEYIQIQKFNADRPESHVNLGNLYVRQGQYEEAEREYRTAIDMASFHIPAYVNLADLYRQQQKDIKGEQLLRTALIAAPDDPSVHYSLGLLLIRQKRQAEAIVELELAARGSATARYSYTFALALQSVGKLDQSIQVLTSALEAHPYNMDILSSLATFHRELGQIEKAREYALKIVEYYPQSQPARQLMNQLN